MSDGAIDRSVLPIRRPPFGGATQRTLDGSQPDWSQASHVQPPKGAPNVLLVLIDDAGFGNPSTFGGPISTPNYTRLADNGLRYNRFHVTALCSEVALSAGARYQQIGETMGALARREPTMAQHVHVAVPDAASAVRALDGLRRDLPLVLALSANSPFWRGSDSGFASIRTPIFSMFPRVGIARRFGNYDEYVRVVETMLRSDAIPEPGFLWWDARLRPGWGTIEVRIMDAQSRVNDAAALAALVHCLVRRHAEGPQRFDPGPEVLAENRFLAARDGLRAQLIDDHARARRPVSDALTELLDDCAGVAARLGCSSDLARARALARDHGATRQRRHVRRAGLGALASWLGAEFAPAAQLTAAA